MGWYTARRPPPVRTAGSPEVSVVVPPLFRSSTDMLPSPHPYARVNPLLVGVRARDLESPHRGVSRNANGPRGEDPAGPVLPALPAGASVS
jgi:hypothetical protein